jgi:hypothetical protein
VSSQWRAPAATLKPRTQAVAKKHQLSDSAELFIARADHKAGRGQMDARVVNILSRTPSSFFDSSYCESLGRSFG